MREVGKRIINKFQEIQKRNQRLRVVRLRQQSQQAHGDHHNAMAGVRARVVDVDEQVRTGVNAATKHVRYKKARKKRFGKKK